MTTVRAPRLEKITPANLEAALALRVRPEQEFAVDPVAHSLAEAYVRPGKAWPRVIVDDGRVVGFVMAFLDFDWRSPTPVRTPSGARGTARPAPTGPQVKSKGMPHPRLTSPARSAPAWSRTAASSPAAAAR
ncbi:hypothetical protein GCM10010250_18350 [Streptomyces althioticus]|nr:hypothetical protein GCM10010250_18350 [Streptomyces althioticus]